MSKKSEKLTIQEKIEIKAVIKEIEVGYELVENILEENKMEDDKLWELYNQFTDFLGEYLDD